MNKNNYNHFNQILVGRNKNSKKLANNTYAIRNEDNSISIKLHQTSIITYYPGGRIVLNSGGYKTSTTKARLNEFSPFSVSQKDGIWSICKQGEWNKSVLFKDGMSFNHGKFVGFNKSDADERKLRKQIKDYSKLVSKSLPLPMPSGGDCWLCSILKNDNKDNSHLISHLKEGYVVPSLVKTALESAGCSPQGNGSIWFARTFQKDFNIGDAGQIGRFVKKYLYGQFGLVK